MKELDDLKAFLRRSRTTGGLISREEYEGQLEAAIHVIETLNDNLAKMQEDAIPRIEAMEKRLGIESP